MRIISSAVLILAAYLFGFAAQRSRMCFIAGLRDYVLVRDGELLKGLFTFLATIWLVSSIFYAAGIIEDGIPAPLFDESKSEAAVESSDEKEITEIITAEPSVETVQEIRLYEFQQKMIGTGIIASPFMKASIIGGLLFGIFTTLAGGCAMRQHVLAAQGNGDAKFFLLGFFSMVIIYDIFFRSILNEWF